jgi:predicted AAA+ superfamily ATPase
MINRIVNSEFFKASCFLWGPRQTGKSTLLRSLFPDSPYYNLLKSAEFRRLNARPGILAEECAEVAPRVPVIVDEIQKIPELLDEIQVLMSERGQRFILTGSSPRKLMRGGGNLLGGRAVRLHMHPFVTAELDDFDLVRGLNNGLLPPHYLARDARPLLAAYVGDYLKEEVFAEALTRNLPAFQRFLEVAGLTNGQIANYATIAREVGVSANTVRGYFEILTETLIGFWLPAYQKRLKRRVIAAPRFYFFDVGLVNDLARRGRLIPGSAEFGAAFEHFIVMELRAHAAYRNQPGGYPLHYWRTASGYEVDIIAGDGHTAIEIKSTENPGEDHLRGLRAFREEAKPKQCILVSRVPRSRVTRDGIRILPWGKFLADLWSGSLKFT